MNVTIIPWIVPELQGSIEEIARLKSREAASRIGGPVITEDTALAFDALGDLPGPYIKWFMDAVGLDGLNDMLIGFPGRNGGKAICTFAYCPGPGAEPIIFQGVTTVLPPHLHIETLARLKFREKLFGPGGHGISAGIQSSSLSTSLE